MQQNINNAVVYGMKSLSKDTTADAKELPGC